MQSRGVKAVVSGLIPLVIGIACFFMLIGPRALNPGNIAWLASGDPAQHYLGWLFFRHSSWSFPVIGSNPEFGLELSNSIVFSDSNPLFAFFFKTISSILPDVFQYFGIWLLICCILQALFAWKLVGIYTSDIIVKAFSAIIFVFSPAMLARLEPGHLSLLGHFLILAALFLVFRPYSKHDRQALPWFVLIATAVLVHGYILAIVFVIWASNVLDRAIRRRVSSKTLFLESLIVISGLLAIMWMAGYFSVGKGAAASGFGSWHFNLAAPINPAGWSYLLREIPAQKGYYSDNNFLGLGVICLLLLAGVQAKTNIQRLFEVVRMHPAFFMAQIAMVIFAASNHIGIGPWIITYDIPEPLLKVANVFRVSNRMFWPAYYLLFLAAVTVVLRFSKRQVVRSLVILAALAQITDTSAGWFAMRHKLMVNPSSEWQTDLVDPFWLDAASRYRKIKWIRPINEGPAWKAISYLAGTQRIGTDAVYLARISDKSLQEAGAKAESALVTGNYARDTLYILDDGIVGRASHSLHSEDLLARVNQLNVLAPHWKDCADCTQHPVDFDISASRKPLHLGESIYFDFSNKGGGLYLLEGWHPPEWLGTWTDGNTGKLLIPFAESIKPRELQLEVYPLLGGKKTEESITVVINGVYHPPQKLTGDINGSIKITVDPSLSQAKAFEIQLITPAPTSPHSLGINKDDRILGVKLRSIRLM